MFESGWHSQADHGLPSLNGALPNGAVVLDAWTHVALVRHGDICTLYRNGTPVASQDGFAGGAVYTDPDGTDPFGVGVLDAYIGTTAGNGLTHVNGYLDDVRITRGAALYTAAFTPSTTPLPDPVLHVVAAPAH